MAEALAEEVEETPVGLPADADDERDETVEQILATVYRLFEAFSNRCDGEHSNCLYGG